jgi:dipeptidyl-peptidase-4
MGKLGDGATYAASSNTVHAKKLTGALMLIVGELDTNVDPASTMQVANALNLAQKDYELLVMPGEGHGVNSRSEYSRRRQSDFFRRALLGESINNRNAG